MLINWSLRQFPTVDNNKNQRLMNLLLYIDTNSIILSHTPCKFDPLGLRIAYSKCTIKEIPTPPQ